MAMPLQFILMICVNIVLMLQITVIATVQIQERHKAVEKIRVNELDGVRDLLHRHVGEQAFTNQVSGITT